MQFNTHGYNQWPGYTSKVQCKLQGWVLPSISKFFPQRPSKMFSSISRILLTSCFLLSATKEEQLIIIYWYFYCCWYICWLVSIIGEIHKKVGRLHLEGVLISIHLDRYVAYVHFNFLNCIDLQQTQFQCLLWQVRLQGRMPLVALIQFWFEAQLIRLVPFIFQTWRDFRGHHQSRRAEIEMKDFCLLCFVLDSKGWREVWREI